MDAEKENYGSIENQESKQSRLVDEEMTAF